MDSSEKDILALDYGAKRIGVARASQTVKIAQALPTIEVDGKEIEAIAKQVHSHNVDTIVVGWPRNLQGEETAQTREVEQFIEKLSGLGCTIIRQDETLTSVQAETELRESSKTVQKADIDARSAQLILEDYLKEMDLK